MLPLILDVTTPPDQRSCSACFRFEANMKTRFVIPSNGIGVSEQIAFKADLPVYATPPRATRRAQAMKYRPMRQSAKLRTFWATVNPLHSVRGSQGIVLSSGGNQYKETCLKTRRRNTNVSGTTRTQSMRRAKIRFARPAYGDPGGGVGASRLR
jgi:hypothetical protein